jgi:F0F1-type ATP synthase assembly protein I
MVSNTRREAHQMATQTNDEYTNKECTQDHDATLETRLEAWTAVGVGVGALVGAPLGGVALGVVLGAALGFFVGNVAAISASERRIECYA